MFADDTDPAGEYTPTKSYLDGKQVCSNSVSGCISPLPVFIVDCAIYATAIGCATIER